MITRAAGVIGDGINVGTLGNIYQVVIHLQWVVTFRLQMPAKNEPPSFADTLSPLTTSDAKDGKEEGQCLSLNGNK